MLLIPFISFIDITIMINESYNILLTVILYSGIFMYSLFIIMQLFPDNQLNPFNKGNRFRITDINNNEIGNLNIYWIIKNISLLVLLTTINHIMFKIGIYNMISYNFKY